MTPIAPVADGPTAPVVSPRWVELPPDGLERQVRWLYRRLVQRWGSSRDPLRLVSLPTLLWLTPRVALASEQRVVLLARARPDRRVQLDHANREQSIVFAAGRLEGDPLAPWSEPLRALLFENLRTGLASTGIDAAMLCTGPARWHDPAAQALACALACHAETWPDAAGPDGPLAVAWPASLPWPASWAAWGQAYAALAAASGRREGSPGATWVVLGGGDATVVTLPCRVQLARAETPGSHEPWPPGALPLWSRPPAGEDGSREARVHERLAAAVVAADPAALGRGADAWRAGAGRVQIQDVAAWVGWGQGASPSGESRAAGPVLCRIQRRRLRPT